MAGKKTYKSASLVHILHTKQYTISFCRQRAELKVLMKVASRADKWKEFRSYIADLKHKVVFFSRMWGSTYLTYLLSH